MITQKAKAWIIAAPASGSGKTLVTLGLLRALTERFDSLASAKIGPDYIDPAFHRKACRGECVNLDLWAMGKATVRHQAALAAHNKDCFVIEGVMGLFDGAESGAGSTADIATCLNLPVILVVDAGAQAHSVAALLLGFKTFRPDIKLAAVIFNRVGSERHGRILRQAAADVDLPVLASLPRDKELRIPSRHLGLVQADEQSKLDQLIDHAASHINREVDFQLLTSIAGQIETIAEPTSILAPLGQRIAVACDEAFSFCYPHFLDGWRQQGAEILPFSPLGNDPPDPTADAVFLPGGYPELHAGRLASNRNFNEGLRKAARENLIYAECGGFMVLGEGLIDRKGEHHQMADLLPVITSFETPKRHLGYRQFTHQSCLPWPEHLRGHEFHYSTLVSSVDEQPLFQSRDACGRELAPMGVQRGRVIGSYGHVIAPAPTE